MDIRAFEIKFSNGIKISGSKIIELIGFSDFATEFETVEASDGNGVVVVGEKALPRNITLTFSVNKEIADDTFRAFKQNQSYQLQIGEREITCNVERIRLNYEFGYFANPVITLNLYCPNPYFEDISDFGLNIAGIASMFGFPWVRPTIALGITMGYKLFSDRTIFRNNGDLNVGFKIIFKSARGSSKNVYIKHLTDNKMIKVNNLDLVKNDVVEISTVAGKKYITKNGINIYSDIDRESEFFTLNKGDNFLEFGAEIGKTNLDVYLYYTPLYSNGLVVD